jgi:hypothetical protein
MQKLAEVLLRVVVFLVLDCLAKELESIH